MKDFAPGTPLTFEQIMAMSRTGNAALDKMQAAADAKRAEDEEAKRLAEAATAAAGSVEAAAQVETALESGELPAGWRDLSDEAVVSLAKAVLPEGTEVFSKAHATGLLDVYEAERAAAAEGGDETEPKGPEIPADWRKLHHSKRIALAKEIAPEGAEVKTAGQANAIIEAEEAQRAADALAAAEG